MGFTGFNSIMVPTGSVISGISTIGPASSTFDGKSFSTLKMTPGTHTISWGSNGNSDFITLNVVGTSGEVPEPTSAAIVGFLLIGSAMRQLKRGTAGRMRSPRF